MDFIRLSKTKKLNVFISKKCKSTRSYQFSPGDLNVEKIYSNANAEIWRKNK